MAELSVAYVYPAVLAPHLFTVEEFERLNDDSRRITKFREVTSKVSNARFLIVPFMDTIEQKASLYIEYSKELKRNGH